jgi:DNA-binding transcriptional ArsR family regulator
VTVEVSIRAIAEPRRRDILRLVWDDELRAGAIADRFPEVSRPAISQHLRVLKDAGLLIERREGTRRLYRARRERITELRTYFEGFWDDRLYALRDAAELGRTRRGPS